MLKDIVYAVLPIVLLIIAVAIQLHFAHACDDENSPPLEVFQQKIVKNSSELCVIPITPLLFKWNKNPDSVFQIEYNARIAHHPDLPPWLQYTYDEFRSEGFLYGVPPSNIDGLNLHIIAWNREDEYSVRKLIISIDIMQSQLGLPPPPPQVTTPAPGQNSAVEARTVNSYEFVVELKIDNMNVKDLCRSRRMDKVVGVFTKYMNWHKLSGEPVRPVYLASAVKLGENRVPLKPTESEGVILHLGSDRNFSVELYKLQSEVSQLWKLRPCPRDVKRTSMERFFRNENVLMDWCSFRLVSSTSMQESGAPSSTELPPDAIIDTSQAISEGFMHDEVFYFTGEIPQKSYVIGIVLATVIPGSIGSIIGFLLLALFWQDRDEDSPVDGDALFFEAAFRFLVSLCRRRRRTDEDSTDNDIVIGAQPYQQHSQLYKSPTGDEDVVLITRDRYSEPPKELNGGDGRERTPMPPQYGETHPNGSPAILYAV